MAHLYHGFLKAVDTSFSSWVPKITIQVMYIPTHQESTKHSLPLTGSYPVK